MSKMIVHFYGSERKELIVEVLKLTFDTDIRFDNPSKNTFLFNSNNKDSLLAFKESITELNGNGLVFTDIF